MGVVYEKLMKFKDRYPGTWGSRLKKHAEVVENNLLSGEKVIDAFYGKHEYLETYIGVITDRRFIFARKNLLYGSEFYSIDKNEICKVSNSKDMIYSTVSVGTLNRNYTFFSKMSTAGANSVAKTIARETIDKRGPSIETKSVEGLKVKKEVELKSTSTLEIEKQKQILLCMELDAFYRERLRVETDPAKIEELRKQLINNYNRYCSLTGMTNEQIETPQVRMLTQKTNNR